MSEIEAFRAHMRQTESECIEWSGNQNENGYGRFIFRRRARLAHRAAWELFRGDIPAGLCVLHKCDNPICVNPEHLFLGDRGDNARDMAAKGRQWLQVSPERRAETLCCPPERRARGSGHGNSKLDEAGVLEIRIKSSQGQSGKSLALEYNCSTSLITPIIRGQSWTHVGGPIKPSKGKS